MRPNQILESFLTNDLFQHLNSLDGNTKPQWGTMNVHQMIEHLAWPFMASNGKMMMPLSTPEDKVERVKAIGLLNDRPMQRLFNNPILTDEYKALKHPNIESAIEALRNEVDLFMHHFKTSQTEVHNIFGSLNYNEWLWFHYKHCKHHLEQFGIQVQID